QTYQQYYDFHGSLAGLPPHRILAINRGEREGVLKVAVEASEGDALGIISRYFPADDRSPFAADLHKAASDSIDRMLAPSLEREMRGELTERAEAHATEVFALNLRPLLLQPPLRGRTVVGIDPGFRTGCKVAVVDETGKMLETTVIYPHPPQQRRVEAKSTLKALAQKYGATIFAVGSGTASRETEEMVAELTAGMQGTASYALVDEAGASVYSVSEIAREEFPDLDATDRGAISIARRLQDPLAELVKVDPRAAGVGLYQHDVDQKALSSALDRVVESAVTFAGVDVNTASAALLHRVAGLNRKVATAIVIYREQHGKFRAKAELSRVPGLGPRAYEQAAGFLQVPDSADILDRTFIHPESYAACKRLIEEFPVSHAGESLSARAVRYSADLAATPGARARLATRLGIGEPTLADLLENLARPGIDPRSALPPPLLRTSALSLDDLQPGTILQGTVRNVVDFGAFIDVGLKQAGLVHVSELADRFVKSPLDVVTVGQIVTVRVLSVDAARGRIGLSMRAARN
ncbi:MAG: RNA-binding protein, partial [Chloroflexi bacterium]|nr:RNA-binding protein [Chloroflexota bacterium]